MTRDDIIRMAREAELCDADGRDSDSIVIASHLERFANLVAAAEREACIKLFSEQLERFANLIAAAEREACAAQVEERWLAFEELKAAHYRQTPEPFDPFRYHKDLGTIFFSRDMAAAVRARPEHSKDKTL